MKRMKCMRKDLQIQYNTTFAELPQDFYKIRQIFLFPKERRFLAGFFVGFLQKGPVPKGTGLKNQNMENSWNSRLAEIPATRPPTVWQAMALPVRWLLFRASIMATWVLKYPLQHMHMAVNTAIS